MAKETEEALLTVTDLHAGYGAIRALRGVSINVNRGEIVTLIGANGGGKSTLLRTITGLIRPHSGTILFEGQPIHGLRCDAIVRLGIMMVPEGRGILREMSVMENLEMGGYHRRDRSSVAKDLQTVLKRFPILAERQGSGGNMLSVGQQQMLALGRALVGRPKLLILDEPSLGLAPLVVAEVMRIIKEVRDEGITVLLAEQNARMALECADRAYVFETGTIKLEGDAKSLMTNQLVRDAYLGVAS